MPRSVSSTSSISSDWAKPSASFDFDQRFAELRGPAQDRLGRRAFATIFGEAGAPVKSLSERLVETLLWSPRDAITQIDTRIESLREEATQLDPKWAPSWQVTAMRVVGVILCILIVGLPVGIPMILKANRMERKEREAALLQKNEECQAKIRPLERGKAAREQVLQLSAPFLDGATQVQKDELALLDPMLQARMDEFGAAGPEKRAELILDAKRQVLADVQRDSVVKRVRPNGVREILDPIRDNKGFKIKPNGANEEELANRLLNPWIAAWKKEGLDDSEIYHSLLCAQQGLFASTSAYSLTPLFESRYLPASTLYVPKELSPFDKFIIDRQTVRGTSRLFVQTADQRKAYYIDISTTVNFESGKMEMSRGPMIPYTKLTEKEVLRNEEARVIPEGILVDFDD